MNTEPFWRLDVGIGLGGNPVHMLNEPILIKSEWTEGDLDGRTVEFRIMERDENGQLIPVQGNGVFRVTDCPDGLIRIEIVVSRGTPYDSEEKIFFCPQETADLIVKQAPGSQFDFSLFEF
jgi:hypothetical protein